MGQKIKCFLVSVATGLLSTTLVVGAQYAITGVYFHTFAAAGIATIWLMHSLILWGVFFQGTPRGEAFVSNRLVICLVFGFVVTAVMVGAMLSLGKFDIEHPLAILKVKNLNPAGVMFIWILVSGLFYGKKFNP